MHEHLLCMVDVVESLNFVGGSSWLVTLTLERKMIRHMYGVYTLLEYRYSRQLSPPKFRNSKTSIYYLCHCHCPKIWDGDHGGGRYTSALLTIFTAYR